MKRAWINIPNISSNFSEFYVTFAFCLNYIVALDIGVLKQFNISILDNSFRYLLIPISPANKLYFFT